MVYPAHKCHVLKLFTLFNF